MNVSYFINKRTTPPAFTGSTFPLTENITFHPYVYIDHVLWLLRKRYSRNLGHDFACPDSRFVINNQSGKVSDNQFIQKLNKKQQEIKMFCSITPWVLFNVLFSFYYLLYLCIVSFPDNNNKIILNWLNKLKSAYSNRNSHLYFLFIKHQHILLKNLINHFFYYYYLFFTFNIWRCIKIKDKS